MTAKTRVGRVRDSREDDLERVCAIYGHHVRHGTGTFEEEPPALEEMARRRAAVVTQGLPYLVVEEGGDVVGFAYAGQYRPRAAYRFTVESSVYVDHTALGRGYGRALMADVVARCSEGPWRQMLAVIGDSANTASVRLHERLGFRPVGTFRDVGFKFGRWLDTVLMQRMLGRGLDPQP
jgi:phosphinothricin acetyltransferase